MSNAKKPDWLAQVAEVAVTEQHSDGRSEVGAVLSAVADTLTEESEPFKANDVLGVVIERGDETVHSLMVSSGNLKADTERVAQQYGVAPVDVWVMSGVMLLDLYYQGIARCREAR